MGRKEITRFLSDLTCKKISSDKGYYSKEVTLDYNTSNPKRIDFLQFTPNDTTYVSGIEKGFFTCYEIKSCKEDVYSGNGLNFYGEKNYIVTTMDTYKALQEDLRSGKLQKHICEVMKTDECPSFGFMVAVPEEIDLRITEQTYAEYESPTKISDDIAWKLWAVYPQVKEWYRTRSMTELLFCMLRSTYNY